LEFERKASEELFQRAKSVTPGGTFDAMRMTQPSKIAFSKAYGSHVWDVDNKEYIDCHLGFGPLILGHRHPKVIDAVLAQLETGDIWNAGINELEVKVAEKISDHVPSAENVRFSPSGTEAVSLAIRLARAYTKRKKLIKFIGAYHGTHDDVLVDILPPHQAKGKRIDKEAYVESDGLSEGVHNTLTVPYNNIEAVEEAFKENKEEIAAVIVEPVMHSAVGCILPEDGFLNSLRETTERNGSLLIFDEVITGFRHALGGVQSIYHIMPDLTIFAKALANGFPIAAVGGVRDVMNHLMPRGGVVQYGTYIAHPVSLAAAEATISVLETGEPYKVMINACQLAAKEIESTIEDLEVDAHVISFKSILMVYFTRRRIREYKDLVFNNNEASIKFKRRLLEEGILTLPLPLKRFHFSAVHSSNDVKVFTEAARTVLSTLKKNITQEITA
jgi:glutamate-1-semialdehyde 2,1-aminomutase